MTCTGSLAIKEVVDNFRYSIIFNKNIFLNFQQMKNLLILCYIKDVTI